MRISRLSLHEKGIDYDLIPIDIFAPEGASADYLERQPFGKIPSFEYDGFRLYETGAITRYIDDVFPGWPRQVCDHLRLNWPGSPRLVAWIAISSGIAANVR